MFSGSPTLSSQHLHSNMLHWTMNTDGTLEMLGIITIESILYAHKITSSIKVSFKSNRILFLERKFCKYDSTTTWKTSVYKDRSTWWCYMITPWNVYPQNKLCHLFASEGAPRSSLHMIPTIQKRLPPKQVVPYKKCRKKNHGPQFLFGSIPTHG